MRKLLGLLLLSLLPLFAFGQRTSDNVPRPGDVWLTSYNERWGYDTTKYYFDAVNGNDAWDGHTPAIPKKTWTHMLTLDLEAGDSVLFNKGDTWRLTADGDMSWRGAAGNHITFASYGTGNKPRILGSDTTTAWSDEGSNVWSSVSTFAASFDPVSDGDMIWFIEPDDSVFWGIWESGGTGSLNAEYEFWYNATTDVVYVYSTSDPATAYKSVEVPLINQCIELQVSSDSAEYYTFDGLEIAFFDYAGIRAQWPGGISGQTRQVRGLEIRNCLIHHGGDKDGEGYGVFCKHSDVIFEDNEVHNMGRRGFTINPDGSEHMDTVSNILVQDNYFHTGWHTTGTDINISGSSNLIIDSVIVRRNIIEHESDVVFTGDNATSVSIYFDNNSSAASKIENVWVYNNLIKYSTGAGIQIAAQGTSGSYDDFYLHNNTLFDFSEYTNNVGLITLDSSGTGSYTDVYIRNNIAYSSSDSTGTRLVDCWGWNGTGIALDYNLFYSTNGATQFSYDASGYSQAQWSTYKTATGWDANSPTPADPLFKDAPTNLRVGSASDAVGGGIYLPGYITDYEGVTVSNPPNIGAYETTED